MAFVLKTDYQERPLRKGRSLNPNITIQLRSNKSNFSERLALSLNVTKGYIEK
jgi:hypothetical protein